MRTGRRFADFFDPLVATPEATEAFRERLTDMVRHGSAMRGAASDPYDLLYYGLLGVAGDYRERQAALRPQEEAEIAEEARNIGVGAALLTVNALKAVGGLYAQYAHNEHGDPVPQRRSGVQRSVDRALGLIWGLANRNKEAAVITVYAMRDGADLRDGAQVSKYTDQYYRGVRPWGDDLTNAFVPTTDAEGQVSIAQRHRPLESTSYRRCPVISEVMPDGESSLWRYLSLVGDVAVNEIFQYQFPIVDDTHPAPHSSISDENVS